MQMCANKIKHAMCNKDSRRRNKKGDQKCI